MLSSKGSSPAYSLLCLAGARTCRSPAARPPEGRPRPRASGTSRGAARKHMEPPCKPWGQLWLWRTSCFAVSAMGLLGRALGTEVGFACFPHVGALQSVPPGLGILSLLWRQPAHTWGSLPHGWEAAAWRNGVASLGLPVAGLSDAAGSLGDSLRREACPMDSHTD